MRLHRATLALCLLAGVSCVHGSDTFAPLRQAAVEAIPGTLSYELEPVGGFRPKVEPGTEYEALARRTTATVVVTLATVLDTDSGTRWGPAWVFFARDVCFASSKGDVVSPARSGNDACSDANMWVKVVDATNGTSLGSFTAYEGTGRWLPDREGDPAQVPGAIRFH